MPDPTNSVISQREIAAMRREKVMQLYVRGMKTRAIAAKLGQAVEVIQNDIKTIERGWKASPFAVAQYNTWMSRQLAKLDEVEYEAWTAWQRSKEPMEETISEVEEAGHGGKGKQRARVTKRESAGDPRFLATVNSVVKQRSSLLGLYVLPRAPIDPTKLTDEQLQKLADGADPREILGDYAIILADGEEVDSFPDD